MTMKSYPTFEAWLNDQAGKNQKTIKALRNLINDEAPQLEEKVKWGNGCFMGKNNGVIYLYADKEWVQYGFFNGVTLSDPKKKLEGSSKYIRHIKVRSPAEIDRAYFANLLQQAVRGEAKSPNLPTKNPPIFEGLSRPALAALAEAKITSLAKLAKRSESELLALHGFGPASLPIVHKILKAKNLKLKAEAPEIRKKARVGKTKSVAKTKVGTRKLALKKRPVRTKLS